MTRLVIYGAGGFGREIWSVTTGTRNIAFCDDTRTEPLLGTPVIRPADIRDDDEIFIATADPNSRCRIEASLVGRRFASIVSPSAIIAPGVEIGSGSFFGHHTHAAVSAQLGRQLLCHVYAYIGHENVVGDHVTIGPRASLNGNVTVGDRAYIGSAAVVRQGLTIGRGAIIGMGSVVTKDVPDGAIIAGNPARPLARPALKAVGQE